MPRKTIQPEHHVIDLSILDEAGEVDAGLAPELNHDALRAIYRAMVLTRVLDERMINMQRQGEMGTFAPGRGQEATQIGQVFPLRSDDWFAPSYRSLGAQIWRGWPIDQLLLLWDGFFEGFAPPPGVNDLPFSIVIGSHTPMAVGVGMALTYRGSDAVMLTNFGDGASSEGDVNESLNFAAVFRAPVVFICENNGYAISMRAEQQAAVGSLAHRAPAFGMPGIRVDGNDVLAMIVATREAVERARSGQGPTLIEAVTYRMEMHTTADDPTVYRTDDEVARWEGRDPIARFAAFLQSQGALDDASVHAIGAECKEQVRKAREQFRERAQPKPEEMFDFVYRDMPPDLASQKIEYQSRLKRMLYGEAPRAI